jgi:elongation factor Ts
MADYSAADVKRLRDMTAAGMMDCKAALVEAEGDFDKAVEILRIKGAKGVGKREGRSTSNGLVTALLDGNASGTLLDLNCETDFVGKGERFIALADEIVKHIAANKPADVDALLSSELGGKPVKDVLDEANASMGEKIEVRRFATYSEPFVYSYLHKTSPDLPPQIGVLLQLTGDNAEIAKDIAQHIAAFSPSYVRREDVPADVVENERRIAEATAREEGKPEAALPKIVEGRVTGYFKDNCLVEQAFAKDNKKSVQQVLTEVGLDVASFARFKVGQD